ncbi:anti-sigma factor [Buttiauxella selenatireducens]|uniref:Anti-sigma factor n=1 Tax=Buttiauxella selenatireducens TaxID=3073902 RepID=A0ABY9S796_9ENTR|nr:anti-sigma factor [Buttiauxella sp. R73]WMY73398.1 anti-sigma factor [Buttiauxella sp. R73]
MTITVNTDELLVAYLDNELSPTERQALEERLSHDALLAERLVLLERSSLPFKSAFAPLLDAAPAPRLQAYLTPPTAAVSRRQLIAAAVSFLALGVIGDRAFLHFSQPEENWRELVAQYMALYTAETLVDTPLPEALENQLRSTGQQLGLTLTSEKMMLPDATLKNARTLAYEDRRIAQITWLDPASGPLALCITGNAGQPMAAKSEQRLGMNIVFWADKTHQFMVIGHGSAGNMSEIAQRLQRKISA